MRASHKSFSDGSGQNGVKFFQVHITISVGVGSLDHLFEFLLGHFKGEFLCDSSEILNRNKSISLLVIQGEDLLDC